MNAAQQTFALILVSLFLAGCMDAATPEAEGQDDTVEPTIYYRNGVRTGEIWSDVTTIHQNAGEWVRVQGASKSLRATWNCTGYTDFDTPDLAGNDPGDWGFAGADCNVVFRTSTSSWSVAWTVEDVTPG